MDGCGPSLHLHREGRVAGVANLEQRQQDGEGGAAVQAPRCHLEGAPVLYADALADEQPQTRPLPRLQLVRVELHPLRTYLQQLFGGETRSCVRNGDAYRASSGIGEPLLRLLLHLHLQDEFLLLRFQHIPLQHGQAGGLQGPLREVLVLYHQQLQHALQVLQRRLVLPRSLAGLRLAVEVVHYGVGVHTVCTVHTHVPGFHRCQWGETICDRVPRVAVVWSGPRT
mmetsp:Transcript_13124/g.29353  ORF Transcript_13124/g.29353 Transcript_13124/m.29353 type:complete len:226 (-) Transcript_13124:119-796(-)